ncbi:MAG: LamG domain-containing protein [Acidobacteria bacterium]|nr:LamG domain-containing protein [Acidobacteriota bacterium]
MKNYILASLTLLAVLLSAALLMQEEEINIAAPQAVVAPPPVAQPSVGAGPAPVMNPSSLAVFKGIVTEAGSKRMVRWVFGSGVAPGNVRKDEPVLFFYTKSLPIRYSGVRGSSVFLNEGGSGETLMVTDKLFPMQGEPRSIGAWIKTSSASQPAVVSCGEEGPHRRLSLMVSIERKFLLANVGDDFTGITTVNDGRWHLLIMTYDGKQAKLYVDGKLDASRDVELKTTSNGHCEVGSVWADQSFFTGMINSVFVSNYVLSAVDVQDMAATVPSD